ncbi:hypothetical protein BH09VER1_BH09VER1_28750 [soil metagenome]
MSASLAQLKKYRVLWAQICEVRGWCHLPKVEVEAKRKALHAELDLPDSSKDFTNRHMDTWVKQTAPLRNDVDIRDRARETVEWTTRRLIEAFQTVLGRDYARNLMIAWRDTVDLDKFPLEDQSLLDLQNLRNTLKNRLGRIIQRIRDGEVQPGPDCPKFHDQPQSVIISSLINREPIVSKAAAALQAVGTAQAEIRRYAMDAKPKQFKPRRAPVASQPF